MSGNEALRGGAGPGVEPLVFPLSKLRAGDLARVGGKGANLGELAAAGFPVPAGFCVTTAAFRAFMAAYPGAAELYRSLRAIDPGDLAGLRTTGQAVRDQLTGQPMPGVVRAAVLEAVQVAGSELAYAVRSSATAEDLPTASFAGQQDTFLNVRGTAVLLDRIRDCWVSLFTDRAILYRIQNGFDHEAVALAVVVQQMVVPEVSGILFTADPATGRRDRLAIDASYGLGEALVAGLVTADNYLVDRRQWHIMRRQVGEKELAIRPQPDGGTRQEPVDAEARRRTALTDGQILALARLGAAVEAHYGAPQDIEWGLASGRFVLLQTRPITTLYPVPAPIPDDDGLRVYVSFNHAQVMTDAMTPMGISVLRFLLPFGKPAGAPIYNPYLVPAGGRLYIDATPMLRSRRLDHLLLTFLEAADPLIQQSARSVAERPEFAARVTPAARPMAALRLMFPMLLRALLILARRAPEGTAERLAQTIDRAVARTAARLARRPPGERRLAEAVAVVNEVFMGTALQFVPYIGAGFAPFLLLNRIMSRRVPPETLAALSRGYSGNVTTEMDLAVGDLADLARQSPALAARWLSEPGEGVLSLATELADAGPFLQAWRQFLARYGTRGPSEIDIGRPRWQDQPALLLQVIASNLTQAEPGVHRAHHASLAAAAERAAAETITAAGRGILGRLRQPLVRRLIRVLRHVAPVREHPKFLLIRTLGLVRQTIRESAEQLVAAGRLDDQADVWFLELPELLAALRAPAIELRPLVNRRRDEYRRFTDQRPPRVITSDGEIVETRHAEAHLPAGALPGNPVSAGVVEGVARVITDPLREQLLPGEILVAPFTDPGWTPLFINAAGLVMEVGGLMTHGSVVAREYGIPAVVGVVDATRRIQSGQLLRVDGTAGYVAFLDEE